MVAKRRSIQNRIVNNPYYRLQSIEEIAVAAELGMKIDVNQATVDDWLKLPGLSIHQARSLANLTVNGVQFHSLEDIAAVLSLPVGKLKYLEPLLNFYYYDKDSIYSPTQINPNQVSAEILSQIPVIDLDLAIAIVQNRDRFGLYRNLADLQQRLTLSSQLTGQLIPYLRF